MAMRPSSRMRQEVRVAAAAFAEQVVGGHAHVGEGQLVGVGSVPADLVVRRRDGEAVAGHRRHQDGEISRPAVRRGSPVTAATVTRRVMSVPRVGDERLAAVDDPLVAVEPGGGRGCPGIRAASGSVSPKAASASPAAQGGQPLLLAALRCRTGRSASRPSPTAGLQRDRHDSSRRGPAPRWPGTAPRSRRPSRRTPQGRAGRTAPSPHLPDHVVRELVLRSAWSACGATTSRANSSTVLRSASCSSRTGGPHGFESGSDGTYPRRMVRKV